MFKLYQKYLILHFIPPALMSLFFFISFLLTTQLFKLVGIVTQKDIALSVLFELFGHITVSFLPMAIPLSLIFSMIFSLNKLSENSEIIAIRAMGINKYQLLTPFLVIGILFAIIVFILNKNIIPHSNKVFKNTILKLTSKGLLTNIKKGQFYTEIPKVILFTEDISNDGKLLKNLFLKLRPSNKVDQIIMAQKGVFTKENNKSSFQNLRFDLFNGNITSINKEKNEIEKIIFKKYTFPISFTTKIGRRVKNNMRSHKNLSEIIQQYEESFQQLTRKSLKSKSLELKIRHAKIEYWSRYNTPLLSIVFILLGLVFGVKKGRGRSKKTSQLALLIIVIHYILFFGSISIAKKGILPPSIAIFLPTILVFLFAAYSFKNLDFAN